MYYKVDNKSIENIKSKNTKNLLHFLIIVFKLVLTIMNNNHIGVLPLVVVLNNKY